MGDDDDPSRLHRRMASLQSFMDVSRSACTSVDGVLDGLDNALSEVDTNFAPFISRTRRLRRTYHNAERALREVDRAIGHYDIAEEYEDYLMKPLPPQYKTREAWLETFKRLVDASEFLHRNVEQQTARAAAARTRAVLAKSIQVLLDDFRQSLGNLDWADWNDFERNALSKSNGGRNSLELVIDSMSVDVISASLESIYHAPTLRKWMCRVIDTLRYADDHGAADGASSTSALERGKEVFCEVRENLYHSILNQGLLDDSDEFNGELSATADLLSLLWCLKIKIAAAAMSHERELCNELFKGGSDTNAVFAIVVGKTIVILLNFARNIIERLQDSKKLFIILKMHKSLVNAMPSLLKTLGAGDVEFYGETVMKLKDIIRLLSDSTKNAFRDMELLIRSSATNRATFKNCPDDGSVHFLPSEVVNFLRNLLQYPNAIDLIFSDIDAIGRGKMRVSRTHLDDLMSHGLGNLDTLTESTNHTEALIKLGTNIVNIVMVLHGALESKASAQFSHDKDLFNIFMVNNLHYVYWAMHRLKLDRVVGAEWFENQSKVIDTYIIAFLTPWFAIADTVDPQVVLELSTAKDERDDPSQPIAVRFKHLVSSIRHGSPVSSPRAIKRSSSPLSGSPRSSIAKANERDPPKRPSPDSSAESSPRTPRTPTRNGSLRRISRSFSLTLGANQDKMDRIRKKVRTVMRAFANEFRDVYKRHATYIVGDPELRHKLQQIIRHIVCKKYESFVDFLIKYDEDAATAEAFAALHLEETPGSQNRTKKLISYVELAPGAVDNMVRQLFLGEQQGDG